MHRKTIPSTDDGRLCKPDVGAVFINSIQRAKVALASESKVSSNSKLVVNLDESIDQFLSDVKQLKIDSIDLVRPAAVNKTASEPINLYKKIAYGSLDLHVLFPLASAAENEKILATVQKVRRTYLLSFNATGRVDCYSWSSAVIVGHSTSPLVFVLLATRLDTQLKDEQGSSRAYPLHRCLSTNARLRRIGSSTTITFSP